MDVVRQEEIDRVREYLEAMPITSEALGKEWITANILNIEERTKKHSLFWLLWYSDRTSKLESWLTVLKASLPDTKFKKIVNSLKEKAGEYEFGSFIPEIEVLAYYASKKDDGVSVEYEPSIPNKDNVGDIKLSFGGNDVYLEVTKLFSSEKEKRIDDTLHLLGSKIDEIANNPFYVQIGIEETFAENDVTPFVEMVQSQIDKYKDREEIPSKKGLQFTYDSKGSFNFVMRAPDGKKGGFGGILQAGIVIKTAGRLKGKIKDEVEQLPENQLNVIVLEPLSFEEFQKLNPESTKTEWIKYKLEFSREKWQQEQEQHNRLRAREERAYFGTINHDCVLWRKQYLSGRRSDFFYNHVQACLDCSKWYAARKDTDKYDINGVGHGSDNYEELRVFGKEYEKTFRSGESFPEDFIYRPDGSIHYLNHICQNCGTTLKANGKCPVCDEPD